MNKLAHFSRICTNIMIQTAWAISTQFFHAQRLFLQARQNTQKAKDTQHMTSKVA